MGVLCDLGAMSSFRRGKSEASLRLYSLPRRELQALCKQYGIPTNKPNVAMADALSACVPVSFVPADHAKPKASWAGGNPLRAPKTTVISDGATEMPRTSASPFTSKGKRTMADREEASLSKPNKTPSRRGVKRSERPPIQTLHEEKPKLPAIPAFPRAAGLQDRFGGSATSSQLASPRRRLRKILETVSRRGGESALPPSSLSGLLSSPKMSESERAVAKHQPEPVVSHTEIEFRNAALHKELFGVGKGNEDVGGAEDREDNASVGVGFEVSDMGRHKELFGLHPTTNATSSQGCSGVLEVQQGLGASSGDVVASECGIFSSPCTATEVLDYSGHEIRVLSSIPEEDESDDSGKKVVEQILPQGRALGPLLDDMACDSPTLSRMEEGIRQAEPSVRSPGRCVPVQVSPLVKAATPLTKIRNDIDCTLTKATSILEKLTALRADAEKKIREGYWEPKFSSDIVKCSSPAAVFKTALVVDRDMPSAKKARLTPKAMILGPGKGLVVCEDADMVSKGKVPSAKTIPIRDESRGFMSVVSDKENQSEMSMDDWSSRKLDGLGKEKKEKKPEVLKDRSKNILDHVNNGSNAPGAIRVGVRPEEMSLRKLRAQFKEKIRHLEASKASDLRPWSERGALNTSHGI